jgi:hypothetical protein
VRHVAVAVQLHVVAALDDRPGQTGLGLHLLADEEEGRPRTRRLERLEQPGCGVPVRAVVERQHDSLGPVRALAAGEPPPALERVDLLAEVGHQRAASSTTA